MFKAFNSIKEILLVFYQVLFVEAKERYEITEVYLEKSLTTFSPKERQCKKENS